MGQRVAIRCERVNSGMCVCGRRSREKVASTCKECQMLFSGCYGDILLTNRQPLGCQGALSVAIEHYIYCPHKECDLQRAQDLHPGILGQVVQEKSFTMSKSHLAYTCIPLSLSRVLGFSRTDAFYQHFIGGTWWTIPFAKTPRYSNVRCCRP